MNFEISPFCHGNSELILKNISIKGIKIHGFISISFFGAIFVSDSNDKIIAIMAK